ncbi:uncharacterized protein LOC117651140 [Thrips palmi]|uniref:Uncharacterized protein LOC117651140 n=1 Tax=Thrips palmi TaxID=161013 RepID=A0A6P8ZZH6_THRPL|nr:uncharacterized protein LOC117651140 [Thrips palmi]
METLLVDLAWLGLAVGFYVSEVDRLLSTPPEMHVLCDFLDSFLDKMGERTSFGMDKVAFLHPPTEGKRIHELQQLLDDHVEDLRHTLEDILSLLHPDSWEYGLTNSLFQFSIWVHVNKKFVPWRPWLQ